jgi:hypothetical protein
MWFLFLAILGSALLCSAGGPAYGQEQIPAPLSQEETVKNPAAPCLEPPPLLRWQDYDGPFAKVVGSWSKKLERKTAHPPHPPHFKPADMLCSLEPRDKFRLFVSDTLDPFSFVSSGFNAALAQASNEDPTFGQGARGYGLRFSADFAAATSSRFLGSFLYPTILGEDPRYYRLHHAGAGTRLLHALRHTVVAHSDNGTRMFNFTEWIGTASSVALSNFFHPGNPPGLAPALRAGTYSMLQDMGMDVLREFWPEIARKLRLPFRGMQNEPS